MASRHKISRQDVILRWGDLELYKTNGPRMNGNMGYASDKVAEIKANADWIGVDPVQYSGNPNIMRVKDLITSGMAQSFSIGFINSMGHCVTYHCQLKGVDPNEGMYTERW